MAARASARMSNACTAAAPHSEHKFNPQAVFARRRAHHAPHYTVHATPCHNLLSGEPTADCLSRGTLNSPEVTSDGSHVDHQPLAKQVEVSLAQIAEAPSNGSHLDHQPLAKQVEEALAQIASVPADHILQASNKHRHGTRTKFTVAQDRCVYVNGARFHIKRR